ncbi:MAG TPA: hypothetical protein VFW78_06195 [Bacteroidia bacterium]|nr:hypothetical protein [Bacteroidia bacterium]
MNKYIEKYWPLVSSILICIVILNLSGQYLDINSIANALNQNTVSICVTLLGFFLTILTIIQAIDNSAMRYIREVKEMSRIYHYLKRAIQFNAIATLSCLILGILNTNLLGDNLQYILNIIFIFIVLMALSTSVRFVYIFLSIIKSED